MNVFQPAHEPIALKVEIANEVKELRSDLRDDLKGRLIRIEADISQMKARNSL